MGKRSKTPLRLSVAVLLVIASLAAGACRAPETALLGGKWNDFSVYQANLIPSEVGTFATLPGASVYHLDITIADDFRTVGGREQVHYTNREDVALDSIFFRLFPNGVGGSTAISAAKIDAKTVEYSLSAGNTVLEIPLQKPLAPNGVVTIELDFTVTVPRSTAGNHGLFAYLNEILALECFYPVIPVYDATGWSLDPIPDDGDKTYQDTAFYLVKVQAPASLTLVASGVEVSRETKDGRQVVTFAAGPARDFYLAGSARFLKLSANVGGTAVNSYYLPGQENGARVALETTENAMIIFGERLGVYPYTELDIVPLALEGGGIGIEYPGVFGIGIGIYGIESVLETTVAHETGHQWFYNIVSNDQVNQPWLDESLTQYITGLYYLDTYGDAGWQDSLNEWSTFWSRANFMEKAIGLPVDDYRSNEYGPIVYGRGPLFFVELAEAIGGGFDDCLQEYYRANKWLIVDTAGFVDYFEDCAGRDLGELFAEWVLP